MADKKTARNTTANSEYRTKKREENRSLLIEKMVAFIGKASDSELYSLTDYVNAKETYITKYNSANRDDRQLKNEIMAERFSNVRVMVIKTENVAEIMAALPVVDAVLGSTVGEMEKFVVSKGTDIEDVVAKMRSVNDFKEILEETKRKLLPLVDIACEKNLVRDRTIKDDYRLRNATQIAMREAGFDPSTEEGQKMYAEFLKEEEKRLEEARTSKAKLREENEAAAKLNAKLKEELGIELTGKNGNALLRKAKDEMKAYGIDPASKTAVKDLLKKRAAEGKKETSAQQQATA